MQICRLKIFGRCSKGAWLGDIEKGKEGRLEIGKKKKKKKKEPNKKERRTKGTWKKGMKERGCDMKVRIVGSDK